MGRHYLNTGQRYCYDSFGRVINCRGTGQDAEFSPGAVWPEPRFEVYDGTVLDRLTGLVWLKKANRAGYPLTWTEALELPRLLNQQEHSGLSDWRLPNRRELRSLISHQTRTPALPEGHPFENVFIGWYWTSTSSAVNPGYAWYVHLEGGRMFYGRKEQYYLAWPVRGTGNGLLPVTGQEQCFDQGGVLITPAGTGQDGELRLGAHWPEPRFEEDKESVLDRLTGLWWTKNADLAGGPVSFEQALATAAELNQLCPSGLNSWRVPTINEFETLVDVRRHSPALPDGHPFVNLGDSYCSATSSGFEPDWCMVLHLQKGAVGVGQKKGKNFFVWAVGEP
ncbi:MAG: DUF1566 domain-containing protein [Pseudomonadota bacterium]